MGPDVMCFLRDEASEELVLVGVQAKSRMSLDARTWRSALNSVKYLRIVATPDDQQDLRLKAVQQGGDSVRILRWDCVVQLVGSTAAVVGNTHR